MMGVGLGHMCESEMSEMSYIVPCRVLWGFPDGSWELLKPLKQSVSVECSSCY